MEFFGVLCSYSFVVSFIICVEDFLLSQIAIRTVHPKQTW